MAGRLSHARLKVKCDKQLTRLLGRLFQGLVEFPLGASGQLWFMRWGRPCWGEWYHQDLLMGRTTTPSIFHRDYRSIVRDDRQL